MVCAEEYCKPVRVNGGWDHVLSHVCSSLNFSAILNLSYISRAWLEVSFSFGHFHANARLTVLYPTEAAVY